MPADHLNRRDVLKAGALVLGAGYAAGEVVGKAAAASPAPDPTSDTLEAPPSTYEWRRPDRPVTAVVVGAGNRGNVYASYAARHPEELRIVGVAEPIPHRRARMAAAHGIAADRQWVTWEHVFEAAKFCDAVIITTPDDLHHGPAMAGLGAGYDLLLEKAIAQSWQECKDILRRTTEGGRIVEVCYVLSYTPYTPSNTHCAKPEYWRMTPSRMMRQNSAGPLPRSCQRLPPS